MDIDNTKVTKVWEEPDKPKPAHYSKLWHDIWPLLAIMAVLLIISGAILLSYQAGRDSVTLNQQQYDTGYLDGYSDGYQTGTHPEEKSFVEYSVWPAQFDISMSNTTSSISDKIDIRNKALTTHSFHIESKPVTTLCTHNNQVFKAGDSSWLLTDQNSKYIKGNSTASLSFTIQSVPVGNWYLALRVYSPGTTASQIAIEYEVQIYLTVQGERGDN